MLEAKSLQTLAEIAFCAVDMGNMSPARTIFNALEAARPGHEAPLLGLAMSHYMVDEFERAEEILRALLKEKPEFHLAGAHLAMCLILAGRKEEALPILRELDQIKDPLFSGMVSELLETAA